MIKYFTLQSTISVYVLYNQVFMNMYYSKEVLYYITYFPIDMQNQLE